MTEQIILSQISVDELVSRVVSKLTPFIHHPQEQEGKEDQFLTAKEVSQLLQVSLVSIHQWKKQGKIKFYRFGSRIRFKKSEILQTEKYRRAAK